MTLALISLFLVGLLAPTSLLPSRQGPPVTGGILVCGGPYLLADLTPDDPPLPNPVQRPRQRPRACLDKESSPDDLQPEGVSASGTRNRATQAEPPSHRRDEVTLSLPYHVSLIYALCTLLI
jgi:hypothetical protein